MKITLKSEAPLIGLILLPFVYLAYIWNQLPEKVPMHWNIEGEIDRYGTKTELLLVIFMLPVLIYGLFLIVPKIDPKNKLLAMGGKFQSLKLILTAFMSVLAMYIIYSVKEASLSNPNYIVLLVGLLFVILGNYFKTIKANYFIGIRTPWTLENEEVWKATHKFSGVLWFIGGLIIIMCSLILDQQLNFYVFMTITLIISLIPFIYSYYKFKKLAQ